MSPTDAYQAGPLIAVAQPTRKVKASSDQGVSKSIQANNAKRAETNSIDSWQASMTRRRSRLSATAPAQRESSMIGKVVDAGTSATSMGEPDSDVIIHAAPTDWISPPKFDARLANHTARKMGMAKGVGAGGESASDTENA